MRSAQTTFLSLWKPSTKNKTVMKRDVNFFRFFLYGVLFIQQLFHVPLIVVISQNMGKK